MEITRRKTTDPFQNNRLKFQNFGCFSGSSHGTCDGKQAHNFNVNDADDDVLRQKLNPYGFVGKDNRKWRV